MQTGKKKATINCIAIFFVAVLLLLPFLSKKGRDEYHMVFLGDSVIGNEENGSVVQTVGNILGMSTFNGAFGGSSLSVYKDREWGSVSSNQWCMARLAEAIAYDDWYAQLASMSYADSYKDVNMQALSYFEERMNALSKIDFDEVDVLIIEHGTNDYNAGRGLDNIEEPYDTTTFGGALRYSLKLLQEAYPDMEIVLITPVYCEFGEHLEQTCHDTDFGGGTLDEYVRLEQQIAAQYGVICINAYDNSGINRENAKEYLMDGLHLSDKGVRLVGEYLAKELGKLCK